MKGMYAEHVNNLIYFGNVFTPNSNIKYITKCVRQNLSKKCRYDGLCNGYKRNCKFKLDKVKKKMY